MQQAAVAITTPATLHTHTARCLEITLLAMHATWQASVTHTHVSGHIGPLGHSHQPQRRHVSFLFF